MNPEIVEVVARAIYTACQPYTKMGYDEAIVPMWSDHQTAIWNSIAQAALTAARPAIMEEAAGIADKQAAKWHKEADRHKRSGGRRSDCQQRDLARAALCDEVATAIRAAGRGV